MSMLLFCTTHAVLSYNRGFYAGVLTLVFVLRTAREQGLHKTGEPQVASLTHSSATTPMISLPSVTVRLLFFKAPTARAVEVARPSGAAPWCKLSLACSRALSSSMLDRSAIAKARSGAGRLARKVAPFKWQG